MHAYFSVVISRLESTGVHFTEVLVLVSRAERQVSLLMDAADFT